MHAQLESHPAVRETVDMQWGKHQVRQCNVEEDCHDHLHHIHNDLTSDISHQSGAVKTAGEDKSAKSERVDVILGKHALEREIKGSAPDLRFGIMMSHKDRHHHFGHCGYCKDCKVCRMVAGAARRIYKKADPYRELRPGHTWVMDIISDS